MSDVQGAPRPVADDAGTGTGPDQPAELQVPKPGVDDPWLPGWLVRRPLTAGRAWTGFWAALIVADDAFDFAGWAWYVMVGMAALPTLLATVALLQATPRRHLKRRKDSVLGHFFVRFLALTAAFLVWGVSVVMSASRLETGPRVAPAAQEILAGAAAAQTGRRRPGAPGAVARRRTRDLGPGTPARGGRADAECAHLNAVPGLDQRRRPRHQSAGKG